MTASRTEIVPWGDPATWSQVHLSLEMTVRSQWEQLAQVRQLARQIGEQLGAIDESLNTLCQSTCVACTDICCRRATLWYDFRDLLFIFLYSGSLPRWQISRKEDLSCIHLSPTGCKLKRYERPFICSWYICPDQIEIFQRRRGEGEPDTILSQLHHIKSHRILLEDLFVEVVG